MLEITEQLTADPKSLFKFLSHQDNNNFEIPNYQRPYSWGDIQLENFWLSIYESRMNMELENQDEDQIFFGSIMTSKEEEADKYYIVDGQQRTITFTILSMAIIQRIISDNDINNCLEYEKHDLERFVYQNPIKNKIHKLKVLEKDQEDFKEIQNITVEKIEEEEKKKKKDKTNSKYLKSYIFFYNELKNINKEDLKNLINFIVNKVIVLHINVKEKNTDLAIGIFQTINSMGMPLDEENLAKSNLFAHIKDNNLEKQWEDIFRKKDFNNSDFFNHYLNIKFKDKIKQTTKKSEVLNFMNIELSKKEKAEENITEILDYAKIFQEINSIHSLNYLDSSHELYKKYNQIFTCIKAFHLFKSWIFLPVLMEAIKTNDNIKAVADNIQKIILSYTLHGKAYSGFNKILLDILKDNLSKKHISNTKDTNLAGKLKTKKFSNAKGKGVLYLLTVAKSKVNNTTIDFNNSQTLTLEHIYPIKDDPIKKCDNSVNEEIKEKNLVESLGNMLLISGSWNSSLSNKRFKDKMKDYDPSIESFYIFEKVKEQKNSKNLIWKDEQIKENTEHLIKGMKEVWGELFDCNNNDSK